jgi:hypothetical protein
MSARWGRALCGAVLLGVWVPGGVTGQQSASIYLPLHHPVVPLVEHLVTAGALRDPSPMVRPFTRARLVRSVSESRVGGLNGTLRQALDVVRTDIAHDGDGPGIRLRPDVGLFGFTDSRRDPLRADGAGSVQPVAGLTAEAVFGPVALAVRPYLDNRLKTDPDWHGFTSRTIAGRQSEAYASVQFPVVEAFLGRIDRNWGPSGMEGLALSPVSYGLDHLGYSVGTSAVRLHGVVAQLSDGDSTGARVNRWYYAHRLALAPWRQLSVALWQTAITAGVGRALDLRYLSPLNVAYLTQVNDGSPANVAVGLDVEWRFAPSTRVFGQLLLDDVRIDDDPDKKPLQAGGTLGAGGGLAGGRIAWTASYTVVTNLAYRHTDGPSSGWEQHATGIARNFSDYDQTSLRVSWLARGDLLVMPEVVYLRQGEGDFRDPFPPSAEWNATPTLFAGTVEKTLRAAVGASWRIFPGVWATANAGAHFVSDAGHVAGTNETEFVGRLGVEGRWTVGVGW